MSRIVVTGATGNVGTSALEALAGDPGVDEVVGLARRATSLRPPKVTFVQADVVTDDLAARFAGADVVVHLAWAIQPSHDRAHTRRVNVEGSRRVFRAAVEAGVPALVHMSSVGAYSHGPKDRAVDESWPTEGTPTSFYAMDKADAERELDVVEREHPDLRVVRLRPGLIFKREAGAEIGRLFAGPLLPRSILHPRFIPVVPRLPGLVFQAVHGRDVGEAIRLAVTSDVRGAFNVAAEPVLDPDELGRLLGARPVPVSAKLVRGVMQATWRARLQPTPPGWLDMALGVPVMDVRRAREELGWTPRRTSGEALLELLDGMRGGEGLLTAPLRPT